MGSTKEDAEMTVKSLGANQTEVHAGDGRVVFVSYETPVAALIKGEYFKTTKKWSKTTSRHVNSWIGDPTQVVTLKPQEFFDKLLG